MDSGPGSSLPSEAPLGPPSQNASSAEPQHRRRWCWRYLDRHIKPWLWQNGDWLFVSTEEPCPVCEPIAPETSRDLDSDYETPEQAYVAFKAADEANVDALLEHSKEYFSDTLSSQSVIRDKAKLLLGATSFTLAVFSGGVALLKESFDGAPMALVLLMSSLFVIIVIHFVRALRFALNSITREVTCAVSTQDVVAALALPESGLSETKRRLAADYRSAATRTGQYLVERKVALMLAQGCLKWGLMLMPGLFFCSLFAAYIKSKADTPTWVKPLVNELSGLTSDKVASRAQVDSLERRLATLDVSGVSGRVQALEQHLRDMEQRGFTVAQDVKGYALATQAVRSDVEQAIERARNDSREIHSLVQSFSVRIRKLEEQLEKANRQLEELTKAARTVPGAPIPKNQ